MEVKREASKEPFTEDFSKMLEADLKTRSFKEGSIVKATVSEISRKFVICDLNLKSSGIIPKEEFSTKELENLKVSQKIEIYLERLESAKDGGVVVSREKARRLKTWAILERAHKTQEQVEGIVKSKIKGGLVVDINSCLCFLPMSQLSSTPLKNYEIDKYLNKPLNFIVVKADAQRKNLVVSHRAISEQNKNERIEKFLAKYKEGDIVSGVIKNVLSWGCFIDLQDGVDGLLHVTDMSYSRVKQPSDILTVGQKIPKIKIIKIDKSTKRISLGLRQLTSDPFEDIEKKFEVGKIYPAKISRIVEYGAFASLDDNTEGLCHETQVHHGKQKIPTGKILSPSQVVNMKVLEIDKIKRRISLSYKATIPNIWDTFPKDYPVGSMVSCRIDSIQEFGLFCKIENTEIIGLCHINNISYNPDEQNVKRFKKNEIIKTKILDFEKDQEKIQLSIKHCGKSPFDYFKDENLKVGSIITVSVKEILPKKGIRVVIGNNENLITTIKKSDLALNVQDQRETIFQPGNRLDCAIVDLKPEQSKVVLSVKEKERIENEEAIKKFGKEGKSSGQSLKSIFGKVLGSKKKGKKKDKEDK